MNGAQGSPPRSMLLLWLALALAAGLMLMRILSAAFSPETALAAADNDSLMRLISVRTWLDGQGWFDMNVHRALPPEGVSLHWSRYVDAAIAAIVWPAAQVLPMDRAEEVGLILWPMILLLALVATTARASLVLFGPVAAAISVLGVIFWPVTGYAYFRPGVIDHHNVQILLLTFVILGLVGSERSVAKGIGAGAAAALSLAVGLENLVPIAAAGLVLFVRCCLDPRGDRGRLVAFATTLAVASMLLFAGQTAPAEWAFARCDELAPPVLGLVWIAAAVALPAAYVLPRVGGQVARAGVGAILAGLAVAVALPILSGCADGPYGTLPDEVRSTIATRIAEARPAGFYALGMRKLFFGHVLPAISTVAIASLLWLQARKSAPAGDRARSAVGVLLLFGWIGIAAAFFQVRLLVLAAPVVPLLMGYALSRLLAARAARRTSPAVAAALIGTAASTLFLPAIVLSMSIVRTATAGPSETDAGQMLSSACRSPEILGSLDALPKGRVLSGLNLGTPILAFTKHDVLAAPYHRSAEAFSNGLVPFDGGEAGLRDAVARTAADYLVLCRGEAQGDGSAFWQDLASGRGAPGFAPVAGADPALVVLRVLR